MDTVTLRRALTAALKARDAVAVSALRSALAAIENAGAVDPGHAPPPGSGPIAGAVDGLGAAEVERRPVDVRAVGRGRGRATPGSGRASTPSSAAPTTPTGCTPKPTSWPLICDREVAATGLR